MNQNFTVPAFAEPITSLPDTPTCEAAELKRRFQAPADEVREAHNALAQAHEELDIKVEGIVTETFVGAIHESMLDGDLTEKLNGKADQTALDAQIQALSTEESNRMKADNVLQTQIAAKCAIVTGTYTGTGLDKTQTISLGFRPKAVLVASARWSGNYYDPQMMNLAIDGMNADNICITSNGFEAKLYFNVNSAGNVDETIFRYIAFR